MAEHYQVLCVLSPPAAGVDYVAVDAKRRERYHSTLSISDGTMRMALLGNSSVPLGYESHNLGIAMNAP
jgi:hypothetical protein